MPFFSIILPTYNRAYILSKAIESALAQTFEDWEMIIIDDGSTDDTKTLVKSYSDPRIRYIYQTNQERSSARNNGIENANGEYICFLDSDDYFLPEKLSALHSIIINSNNKEVVFYDGIIFQFGDTLKKIDLPIKADNETIYEFLLLNPLGSLQICAPRTAFKTEKFNPEFRIGEDVELWLRLAQNLQFMPIHNTYNTIAVDHNDRSVNQLNIKDCSELIDLNRFIFSNFNSKLKISTNIKKQILANSFFRFAKYYMENNKKFLALIWTLKTIRICPFHPQIKHYIFCAKSLFLSRIPLEYKEQTKNIL